MELTSLQKSILLELITESNGVGDSVAVYPFISSRIHRDRETPEVDVKLAISELQNIGLVLLQEKAGLDRMDNEVRFYPVYVVTVEGFRIGANIRGNA